MCFWHVQVVIYVWHVVFWYMFDMLFFSLVDMCSTFDLFVDVFELWSFVIYVWRLWFFVATVFWFYQVWLFVRLFCQRFWPYHMKDVYKVTVLDSSFDNWTFLFKNSQTPTKQCLWRFWTTDMRREVPLIILIQPTVPQQRIQYLVL